MARVTISGCVYDEWKAFYDSYQADRARFIKNETVLQQGDHAAEVVFEITDLEGLKDLSQRVTCFRSDWFYLYNDAVFCFKV